MKTGDKVRIPFGGEGIIESMKDIPWGHKYMVKVTKGELFYTVGEVIDFREEDLEFISEAPDSDEDALISIKVIPNSLVLSPKASAERCQVLYRKWMKEIFNKEV